MKRVVAHYVCLGTGVQEWSIPLETDEVELRLSPADRRWKRDVPSPDQDRPWLWHRLAGGDGSPLVSRFRLDTESSLLEVRTWLDALEHAKQNHQRLRPTTPYLNTDWVQLLETTLKRGLQVDREGTLAWEELRDSFRELLRTPSERSLKGLAEQLELKPPEMLCRQVLQDSLTGPAEGVGLGSPLSLCGSRYLELTSHGTYAVAGGSCVPRRFAHEHRLVLLEPWQLSRGEQAYEVSLDPGCRSTSVVLTLPHAGEPPEELGLPDTHFRHFSPDGGSDRAFASQATFFLPHALPAEDEGAALERPVDLFTYGAAAAAAHERHPHVQRPPVPKLAPALDEFVVHPLPSESSTRSIKPDEWLTWGVQRVLRDVRAHLNPVRTSRPAQVWRLSRLNVSVDPATTTGGCLRLRAAYQTALPPGAELGWVGSDFLAQLEFLHQRDELTGKVALLDVGESLKLGVFALNKNGRVRPKGRHVWRDFGSDLELCLEEILLAAALGGGPAAEGFAAETLRCARSHESPPCARALADWTARKVREIHTVSDDEDLDLSLVEGLRTPLRSEVARALRSALPAPSVAQRRGLSALAARRRGQEALYWEPREELPRQRLGLTQLFLRISERIRVAEETQDHWGRLRRRLWEARDLVGDNPLWLCCGTWPVAQAHLLPLGDEQPAVVVERPTDVAIGTALRGCAPQLDPGPPKWQSIRPAVGRDPLLKHHLGGAPLVGIGALEAARKLLEKASETSDLAQQILNLQDLRLHQPLPDLEKLVGEAELMLLIDKGCLLTIKVQLAAEPLVLCSVPSRGHGLPIAELSADSDPPQVLAKLIVLAPDLLVRHPESCPLQIKQL